MKRLSLAVGFFLILVGNSVSVECDCSRKQPTCRGGVELYPESAEVFVSSSSDQCSIVYYFLDGGPAATTVIGGSATESIQIYDQSRPLKVEYDSCYVCATKGSIPPGDARPEPRVTADPFAGTWTLNRDGILQKFTLRSGVVTSSYTAEVGAELGPDLGAIYTITGSYSSSGQVSYTSTIVPMGPRGASIPTTTSVCTGSPTSDTELWMVCESSYIDESYALTKTN